MSTLESLMKRAKLLGCSDLHLHPSCKPRIRLQGELIDVEGADPMPISDLEPTLVGILDQHQRAQLREQGYLDFSYLDGAATPWRCHYYRQGESIAAAFRALESQVPTFEELGLPSELELLAGRRVGLSLFTGGAGSGKTTTLAAVVGAINRGYRKHVVTVEDPIEYVYTDDRSVIEQRAVGVDVPSFARGVEDSLQQGPDVLIIGELRDYETIRAGLTAAETGAYVLGTLHGNDAAYSVDRLLDVLPRDEQPLARVMLSQSLYGVVNQTLVHKAEGKGRLPAVELLINTPAVASLIRTGKVHEIRSFLETGREQGMIDLDSSLAKLVRAGEITREEARRHARRPHRFRPPARAARGRSPEQPEQRGAPRLRALYLVNIEELDEVGARSALRVGRTLDLSTSGVRVELDRPVLLHAPVDMHIALEDRIVEAQGEVRSLEAEDDVYRVGIKFTDVSLDDREALERCVQSHS